MFTKYNKWQRLFFLFVAVVLMAGGCMSKKSLIKDIPGEFDEGTILSAETGKPVFFEELLKDLKQVRAVYVGEQHTNPAHHEIQLRIITELFNVYPNIAVGMEMFDRSYQPVLDQWSAGQLEESEFLKKVHWYANWKFDFELYRNILAFIKEKHIRLTALNIPFHIPPKIAVGGLESLSDDDRKYLPLKIDTSNADHRAYVERIYRHHHHLKGRGTFEHFYEAQCVWEDVMAESAAMTLKTTEKMVILAGTGHIIYKFGIPDRVSALTGGAPFRTVLPISAGQSDRSAGDYFWITQE
jgi:uncharacterized iron-regulated protein